MSRSARRGVLAVAGAAGVFGVAWSFGLWLIVLALSSVATVLAGLRFRARRSRPVRLAAWAVHAPCGLSTPVAFEHAVAVDLAAASEGQLDSLERAQAMLAHTVEHPGRRRLGEERLARAHCLVGDGALVGVQHRRELPVFRLRSAGEALALVVLLAAATLSQSRWWLVPLAVAHALVAWEFVALYERRCALPELLASRSVRDPIEGLFVMPEQDVARRLVMLANHDRVVIRRACCLVERSHDHPHARRRLAEAERLLVQARGSARGPSGGAWLVVVAVSASAATTYASWGAW